jgi:hypothetical protein
MPATKRKGQMEIMGLAIIVILVALGLMFAVQWMLQQPSTKQVQRAKEATLAANFLNTMLGTTTECNKRTMRELLMDCALTRGATRCGGASACEYAEGILAQLFRDTFEEWSLRYHFTMQGASSVAEMEFGEPCAGELEKKVHPLPVKPGFEILLSLEICR